MVKIANLANEHFNALHNASFDTTDLKEIGKEKGINKDDWIEESEIVRKGQLTF